MNTIWVLNQCDFTDLWQKIGAAKYINMNIITMLSLVHYIHQPSLDYHTIVLFNM